MTSFFGHIRIFIPDLKGRKFPSKLRIIGEAVSIQRIGKRRQITVCMKGHCFHVRHFLQSLTSQMFGANTHYDPCDRIPNVLNSLDSIARLTFHLRSDPVV